MQIDGCDVTGRYNAQTDQWQWVFSSRVEKYTHDFAADVMNQLLIDLFREIRGKADVESNKRRLASRHAAQPAGVR